VSALALSAQLARALAAIDADEPAFADELRALAALPLPDLVREPEALDGQLAALFAGLRRLRPLPVWCRGSLHGALATRDAYGLEGALVEAPLPEPGVELPRGRGREVYWRVGAEALPRLLSVPSQLPAGVGVVLDAPDPAELAALRSALRGRAVGIAAHPDRLAAYSGARLDLLVIVGETPPDAQLAEAAVAVRTLVWAEGTVRRSRVGAIVATEHAPSTALWLSGHRNRDG
jgi:hypothetical protein